MRKASDTVKNKHLHDLIIWLQKNYGLYFIEYRQAPNGRKTLVLCNPNNKDWWISLIIGRRTTTIIPAMVGDIDRNMLSLNLYNRVYIGAGKEYQGEWLKL